KVSADQKKHWRAQPGPNVLGYDGKEKGSITTQKEYGEFELVCDCRVASKDAEPVVTVGGKAQHKLTVQPRKWVRTRITHRGAGGTIGLEATGACEFTNLFIRELK